MRQERDAVAQQQRQDDNLEVVKRPLLVERLDGAWAADEVHVVGRILGTAVAG